MICLHKGISVFGNTTSYPFRIEKLIKYAYKHSVNCSRDSLGFGAAFGGVRLLDYWIVRLLDYWSR
jgi:hypothetical protein